MSKHIISNKYPYLFFVDYFYPGFKAGGPIKSVSLIISKVFNHKDTLIITSSRDIGDSKSYPNIKLDNINFYKKFNIIYKDKISIIEIYKFLNKYNPKIVWLNSFFSLTTIKYICLRKVFKYDHSVILSVRGELSEAALSIKGIKKSLAIKLIHFFSLYDDIYFHATSKQEKDEIINALGKKRIYTIPNLVEFRKKQKIISKKSGELRLIYLSRITEKKNLHYALNLLLNCTNGNIIFDIYGPIEDLKYWEKCKKLILLLPPNIVVNYRGYINSDENIVILCKYHSLILPTLNENFGHVIVEAMQCGVIPIISNNTPWNGLCNMDIGWSLSLNQPIKFTNAINKLLYLNDLEFKYKSNLVVNYINNRLNNDMNIRKYKTLISLSTNKSNSKFF